MRSALALTGLVLVLAGCGERSDEAQKSASSPENAGAESTIQSIDCSQMVKFEPEAELSGADYLKLAGPDAEVARSSAGRIGYRAFDYEDTVRRDGWIGLGVVSVDSAKPTGGVVWVKEAMSLSPDGPVALETVEGGHALKLGLGEVANGQEWSRCAKDYVVHMDADGRLSARS